MKKPRLVIETITEVVLAVVLISILGVSYYVGVSLNPVAKQQKTVLGIEKSADPWVFLPVNYALQKSLISDDYGFTANYELQFEKSIEINTSLFTINNINRTPQKYRIQASLPGDVAEYFKVKAIIDGKEYAIFDGAAESKLYSDIVITIPQGKSSTPQFIVTPYSEGIKFVGLQFVVTKI